MNTAHEMMLKNTIYRKTKHVTKRIEKNQFVEKSNILRKKSSNLKKNKEKNNGKRRKKESKSINKIAYSALMEGNSLWIDQPGIT